ncbi:MAG: PEP-CTERM sorting domain-containing protein [Planctomycetota bacterium]
MKKVITICAVVTMILAVNGAAQAAISYDQDVTPNVIFGDGNANGSFTVDRTNGVELGLRAKLRYDATGLPQNTFNSNGNGTYTFQAGIAPTKSTPFPEWNFEFTINTDYEGTSGIMLDDLTYALQMTSTTVALGGPYDVINGESSPGVVYWDHAIGNNSTLNGAGVSATDAVNYATLIGANNVAQQSWSPNWFDNDLFDPTETGSYYYTLTAYNGATAVASTSMTVNVVPEPATMALMALGGLLLRRKK